MSGRVQSQPYGAAPTAVNWRYDGVYRALHWTVVLLLVVQYLTKWLSPGLWTRQELNAWHSAIGPTILLLMLVRLVWRLTHKPPPAPADLPMALKVLSRATHWAFYALLVILPLLGWAAVSGFGGKATILGIVPLPGLIAPNKPLAQSYGGVHATLTWVLLAVIVLHVTGALYHALVKRDGVAQRMLPV